MDEWNICPLECAKLDLHKIFFSNREDKEVKALHDATGYFQCKENHFETRPFHAKFEENR